MRESIAVDPEDRAGERLRLPEFGGGLRRFLFEPNTTATRRQIKDRIGKALARWEPRIRVESVDVEPDPGDAGGRDRHDRLPARRHAGARSASASRCSLAG